MADSIVVDNITIPVGGDVTYSTVGKEIESLMVANRKPLPKRYPAKLKQTFPKIVIEFPGETPHGMKTIEFPNLATAQDSLIAVTFGGKRKASRKSRKATRKARKGTYRRRR